MREMESEAVQMESEAVQAKIQIFMKELAVKNWISLRERIFLFFFFLKMRIDFFFNV